MGKLVLFLVDGSTLDIRLSKERLTIGRRPDNDVCLPHPAVSAEHAAVVTILADSFLEDLGSTNGTYVNGKVITKHFLRDHDMVDIGRQRMTYRSDDAARVEPMAPSVVREHGAMLAELVDGVRPHVTAGGPGLGMGTNVGIGLGDGPGANSGRRAGKEFDRASVAAPPHRQRERRSDGPVTRGGQVDTLQMRMPGQREGSSAHEEAHTGADPAPQVANPIPEIRVLSGPNMGRTMPVAKAELSVGRVGVQVALIRRSGVDFMLIPVEGRDPPRVNGESIAAAGAPLAIGDKFEVAGVELQLIMPVGLRTPT